MRRPSAGFTLIELMICVAIVAILAMVAVPSYRDQLLRGYIADATNGLATVRAQMERHYQDNRTYVSVTGFTTPCAGDVSTRTFGNFLVECVSTSATAFELRAVGSGAANGFTYTINTQDARATTAAPSGWNTCTTKWILKRGQAC